MSARVVWKFLLDALPGEDEAGEPGGKRLRLVVPRDSELLRVALQDGTPCLWALVDPDAELVKVELRLIWTGVNLDRDGEEGQTRELFSYVGSFTSSFERGPGQSLVWHVFEVLT